MIMLPVIPEFTEFRPLPIAPFERVVLACACSPLFPGLFGVFRKPLNSIVSGPGKVVTSRRTR